MDYPVYTADEAHDRETFLALMWALSYPGRICDIGGTAHTHETFSAIGSALLDLETSFCTPDAALAEELLRTGARHLPAAQAAYHFYPALDGTALESIAQARVGSMLRPDEGVTLIIGCAFASGSTFTLAGPGIQTTHDIRLGGIPVRFWGLRERVIRYPLGWDVYFVDHGHVIGLPRTTRVG
jgi:alpha-D-ribose 1-methylphosphonate 5-triphosphate synthase subunit PhnH